jgi:anti-sigma B factor antagonist
METATPAITDLAGGPFAGPEGMPVPDLSVDFDAADQIVLLRGELDMGSAPILLDAIIPLTYAKLDRLTLDLSGVRFMDSTGLATLVAVQETFDALDLPVSLRGVSPRVARLLSITGLEHLFGLEPFRDSLHD